MKLRAVIAVAMSGLVIATTQIVLRNFYRILVFDESFSAIFQQISGAEMKSPILGVFILSYFYGVLAVKFYSPGTRRRIGIVLFSVFAWLVFSVFAICYTRVNEILVMDVLTSLLSVFRNGGL